MIIVLGIYVAIVYLVFVRFKLLPWNLISKSAVGVGGLIITLVVIGALNSLAPSGRVTVIGATIPIAPNVAGTVVSVDVKSNATVKKSDLLFTIDKIPFATEVSRLEAALREAQAAEHQLHADLESAVADVELLEAQYEFGVRRRDDIARLTERGASSVFDMQQAVSTIAQLQASIRAAKARKRRIEIRIASQIDGLDSTVAQTEAALKRARWDLAQTEIRAPADGMVTALTLRPGARAQPVSPVVAFLPTNDKVLSGVFPQAGRHVFDVGSVVKVALRAAPGTSFETTVEAILPGTGEGTIPTTGLLVTLNQLGGGAQFVVRLELPEGLPPHTTAIGTTGSAVMISDKAGPIKPIAQVLFWLSTMRNFL